TKEAIPRSSTVEFGWAVAVRDGFHRDVHVHARHEVEGRVAEQADTEAVSAQMVYHRPTRSGVYAIVSVFAPWRIALNEITYRYAPGVDRQARYRLALEAYKATFARTEGAMTSTRLPHLEEFQGAVAVSTRNFPVPAPSPLNPTYLDTLEKMRQVTGGLEVMRFSSLDGLFRILDELRERPLFTLSASEG
ncbi:MAG: DevR family CRISPR-associated autoregulator, partial [Bryobacteraceae bacterium]